MTTVIELKIPLERQKELAKEAGVSLSQWQRQTIKKILLMRQVAISSRVNPKSAHLTQENIKKYQRKMDSAFGS